MKKNKEHIFFSVEFYTFGKLYKMLQRFDIMFDEFDIGFIKEYGSDD